MGERERRKREGRKRGKSISPFHVTYNNKYIIIYLYIISIIYKLI